MESRLHEETLKVWQKIDIGDIISDMNFQFEIQNNFLNFVSPGNLYHYIFDVKKAEFNYVSPKISDVLGYDANEMTFAKYLSIIHPADHQTLVQFETRIVEFYGNLPPEKITKYKFSYDIRLKAQSGNFVRILQHTIPIKHISEQETLLTLGVHSDISHLKKDGAPTLSFIGLDGEPSFYDVFSTDPAKELPEFTKRELEIIGLLALGHKSDQIASKLFISTHTVNTHRKNILRKSSTKTTAELIMIAMSSGIIQDH